MHLSIAAADQPRARHSGCVVTDFMRRMDAGRPAMVDRSGGYRLRGWNRTGKRQNHSERKTK
jgi:hypothetical protein